jgi:hypothetical protein
MKPARRLEGDPSRLHERRLRRRLVLLGAVALVSALTGCTSIETSENPDPYQYNPNTGYPAIGGPSWGRL